MLLKIFRSNQPYTIFFVLFMALFVSIPLFLGVSSPLETTLTPAKGIFELLPTNLLFIGIIKFALLFIGAVTLNWVFTQVEFLTESNHLTAMWYLMILAPVVHSGWSIPVLTGNIFLFISLNRLLKVFRQPRALSEYFESGFWLGLASICFMPFLLILPFVLLAIIYTRTFNFREVFMPVLGAIIPWVYLFSIEFILKNTEPRKLIQEVYLEVESYLPNALFWVFILVIAFHVILSLIIYLNTYKRSTNRSKNTKSVYIIWSLGVAVSIIPLALHFTLAILLPLGAALALFLSFGSIKMKRDWYPKLINTILLITIAYDIWLKCSVFMEQ